MQPHQLKKAETKMPDQTNKEICTNKTTKLQYIEFRLLERKKHKYSLIHLVFCYIFILIEYRQNLRAERFSF